VGFLCVRPIHVKIWCRRNVEKNKTKGEEENVRRTERERKKTGEEMNKGPIG
jgi:hypothetical protein